MRLLVLLAVVFLGSTPGLFAQSLADVARKESERRQTVKSSGKSFTNKDLKAVPSPPPTPDAGATPADASAGDSALKAAADPGAATDPTAAADVKSASQPDKGEVRDEAYWRKRIGDLRERLDRDQTYVAALQSRIEALTLDFVNRDDPAQRDQIFVDRQKAVSELDRLKKNIEQDRRDIEDTEEEARRAGVPPGWLR